MGLIQGEAWDLNQKTPDREVSRIKEWGLQREGA